MRDQSFRKALLIEGVESFLAGDVETGKAVLRDCINATVGFGELAKALKRSPKSLMRMLGPRAIRRRRIYLRSLRFYSAKKACI